MRIVEIAMIENTVFSSAYARFKDVTMFYHCIAQTVDLSGFFYNSSTIFVTKFFSAETPAGILAP